MQLGKKAIYIQTVFTLFKMYCKYISGKSWNYSNGCKTDHKLYSENNITVMLITIEINKNKWHYE